MNSLSKGNYRTHTMSTCIEKRLAMCIERHELPRAIIDSLPISLPKFGHDLLSQVILLRSYARLKESGGNESWREIVLRVTTGVWSIFRNHMRTRVLQFDEPRWTTFFANAISGMYRMNWMPPGRGLWMMGTDFVYQRGATALNNCAAVSTKDSLVESASWAMDTLMNGGGVGFDTYWTHISERNHSIGRCSPDGRRVEWHGATRHTIPDSREGWVWSVKILLNAYLHECPEITDELSRFPEFDYSLIRPKGSRINGFGGIASGPWPLEKLHKRLHCYLGYFLASHGLPCHESSSVEAQALEEKFLFDLAGIDYPLERAEKHAQWMIAAKRYSRRREYDSVRLIADVFNAIGDCVVSGNVRRSSEIAIGDPESETFLNLKNYELHPERASIGHNSNNSVRFTKTEQYTAFLPRITEHIRTNGEPGLIFQLNMTRYSRIARPPVSNSLRLGFGSSREYEEDQAILSNPCGEICLESHEFCNLSEVAMNKFLMRANPLHSSSLDVSEEASLDFDMPHFLDSLRHAAFYCKCVALLPCHLEETNAIIARNMRIGVSLSGVAVIYDTLGATRMIEIFKAGYRCVRDFDVELSSILGVVPSIRVTTCKPSGTISLLTGATPGIHFAIAGRYARRRVIIGKSDPLAAVLIRIGVEHEQCLSSPDALCFSFYIDFAGGSDGGKVRSEREVGLYEMLSLIATVQREWADNMVSATVTFDQEREGHLLEQAIANFAPLIKSCSFFPRDCTVYGQMPYEAITEEEFRIGRSRVSEDVDLAHLLDEQIKVSGGRGVDPEAPKYCDGASCDMPKRAGSSQQPK